jgi:hypothetical protein
MDRTEPKPHRCAGSRSDLEEYPASSIIGTEAIEALVTSIYGGAIQVPCAVPDYTAFRKRTVGKRSEGMQNSLLACGVDFEDYPASKRKVAT